MAIDRKDLLEWIRLYCNQDFYGTAEDWKTATDYIVGSLVVGTNNHTYISKTIHTSNDNPPPANTTDWDFTETTLPGGVKIALTHAETYHAQNIIKSESLGDYSVTYTDGLPPQVKDMLNDYRRLKTL